MNPEAPAFTPSNHNNNNQNNSRTTIRVILLRHGEREDETEDYDRRLKSPQDRIDPYLTPLGHRQALNAWKKILQCLAAVEPRPVLLASSPLRRCMGTALMISAAAAQQQSTIQFVLPSPPAQSQGTTTTTAIPILVMNGLGDCAAQMQHMGGIGKVVKAGYLDLAASPSNDVTTTNNKTTTTRFQTCFGSICDTAAQVVDYEIAKAKAVRDAQQQPGQHISNDNSTNNISAPVQFWRESRYHYYGAPPQQDLSPMTDAKTLVDHASTPTTTDPRAVTAGTRQGHHPVRMAKNAPSVDERCDQALVRAVLQTAHSNLDTCVLVTHREAIRFVETHWVPHNAPTKEGKRQSRGCSNHQHLSATKLYCCVGVYHVTADMNTNKLLAWQSKGVFPYQILQPGHLN